MNVASSTINVLSLCSGYGGLDLGLDLATGGATRTICYVEREAFAAAILAARMEEKALDAAPVWSDLRTFDGRPWRGVVDCITGGYPCQPFSVVGKRLGEHDERHLWPDIARIVGEVEPGIVFFENVAGHLTLGFDVVRADLERLGYRVAAGLFSAAEVGASHRRERLFILGMADSWCERSQGIGSQGSEKVSAGRGGGTDLDIPVFPPKPGDSDQWQRILRDRPDFAPAVEPGVCGVDDGSAPRLDRLRGLGNGVVPLAAAYAFVSLWACINGGEE
jgi:DNA (cytosine-5)-methyltransferase 1